MEKKKGNWCGRSATAATYGYLKGAMSFLLCGGVCRGEGKRGNTHKIFSKGRGLQITGVRITDRGGSCAGVRDSITTLGGVSAVCLYFRASGAEGGGC